MATSTVHPEQQVIVRYSKFYTAIILFMALAFITAAIADIISYTGELFQGTNMVFPSVYLLGGLLLLFSGIFLRTRAYLKLDTGQKILQVYGVVGPWSRKYPFEFMYYANEKFIIENKGKRMKINVLKYTCDKQDLGQFIKALSNLNESIITKNS